MAVTEACTNAVVHAYADSSGRLDIEMFAAEDRLEVVVRDAGRGVAADSDAGAAWPRHPAHAGPQ